MVRNAVLAWLFRDFVAELHGMEQRIMKTLADLKTAEDAVGTSVANAVAVNAANLKALADAIANGGDAQTVSDLADEAQAHADALNAAFNPTAAPAAPIPAASPAS